MSLVGKNILVTAGPTWTAVDRVRVLTSVFSGETGLRIARAFKEQGCKVTLFMGPGRAKFQTSDWTEMNVQQFFYYDDLDQLLKTTDLTQFDAILHSSAVSDFKSDDVYQGKKSSKDGFNIPLIPTEKLVDKIRLATPESFLVKFKLQVGLPREELHDIALNSLKASSAELIVANNLDEMDGEAHQTYIIDPAGESIPASTKTDLCSELISQVNSGLKSK
ncbi:phosphopantothenoylcysteine synthase/decarboxylase [Lentisphaera araneosa HTCC2155]|uniref:Phosphopantothenoylcysteine synthase/decarboxylase n=1 Tax=Lentisphaera araneosa HTCC2155 TaxID=313628 RepID=A6DPR4_9BACT|nr:phosphopantothenoylcysteine decarboxylase [Lentisphaera araneosa]EDM26359.1 phosphopantothenoylcysteine synthase/decarboxylase [Lentisphaera araneosa HTCC2155]